MNKVSQCDRTSTGSGRTMQVCGKEWRKRKRKMGSPREMISTILLGGLFRRRDNFFFFHLPKDSKVALKYNKKVSGANILLYIYKNWLTGTRVVWSKWIRSNGGKACDNSTEIRKRDLLGNISFIAFNYESILPLLWLPDFSDPGTRRGELVCHPSREWNERRKKK